MDLLASQIFGDLFKNSVGVILIAKWDSFRVCELKRRDLNLADQ